MKKSILFLGLFLIVSCQKKEAVNQFPKLEQSKWILGNWENANKDGNFKEIWVKKNDSLYTAKSFITVGKDTVFYEMVNLYQKNDSLCYQVSVKNQNNEAPIPFWLTKSTENELIFENPKHDFPTKIVYKLVTKDSILASVSGKLNGKEVSEFFPMKKK